MYFKNCEIKCNLVEAEASDKVEQLARRLQEISPSDSYIFIQINNKDQQDYYSGQIKICCKDKSFSSENKNLDFNALLSELKKDLVEQIKNWKKHRNIPSVNYAKGALA